MQQRANPNPVINLILQTHPSTRLVAGIGLNDAKEPVRHLKSYQVWKHMLERCYVEKRGAEVCSQWLLYSQFKQWYDYTAKQLAECGYDVSTLQLDKDLRCADGLVYSSGTCCFLPASLNTWLSQMSLQSNNTTGWQGVNYRPSQGNKPWQYADYSDGKKTNRYFTTKAEAYDYRVTARIAKLGRLIDEYAALLKSQCIYGHVCQWLNRDCYINAEALIQMVDEVVMDSHGLIRVHRYMQ